MRCLLCGEESRLRSAALPGYQQGRTYQIHECTVCEASFAVPHASDRKVYEHIYRNIEKVPGYNRYHGYCLRIGQEPSPLDYLSHQEESYWAVIERLRAMRRRRDVLKVLEVGCGLGYFTYALIREGYDAIGLDVATQAVQAAIARYGNHYVCSDLQEYGKDARETFDVLILNQMIEHVPDVHGLFRSAMQLTRSGGEIIVTTPSKSYAPGEIWQTELPPVHLWWFSEKSLARIGDMHGMAVEFVDFAPFYATYYRRYATNKGTVEQESILNSNGNVAKESSNNGLLQHLKKKLSGSDSILGLYRSVRDGFSGRGRYTASRGPDCCAIFKKRNDIATMSQ